MSEPRETARQIAERLAELEKTCVNMADHEESDTQRQAWLERAELVASLTADLAQAKQERDESDHNHAADIVQLVREVQHWRRRAEDAEGRIANALA